MSFQIISIKKELRTCFTELLSTNGEFIVLKSTDPNPLVYHKKTNQISYIKSGSGFVTLGTQNLKICAGDLIIIPKNLRHSFTAKTSKMETLHIHWPTMYLDKDRYIEKERVVL